MTATMLVLEPIFEADLPPNSTRTASRAQCPHRRLVKVEECCSVVTRKSVDADLADYFGASPCRVITVGSAPDR